MRVPYMYILFVLRKLSKLVRKSARRPPAEHAVKTFHILPAKREKGIGIPTSTSLNIILPHRTHDVLAGIPTHIRVYA